jgi:hypothetical protein
MTPADMKYLRKTAKYTLYDNKRNQESKDFKTQLGLKKISMFAE